MDRLINSVKMQAGRLDARGGQPRFGIVTSIDIERAVAKVIVQPDGVQTGWLPVLSAWAGQGWGMICMPSPGDQVFVLPQEGSAEHGVIVGSAYSNRRPPPSAEVGECWLVHKSGSHIKLTNDGRIEIKGDLHVDGEVYDKKGALGQLRDVYNEHTHRTQNGTITLEPTPQG